MSASVWAFKEASSPVLAEAPQTKAQAKPKLSSVPTPPLVAELGSDASATSDTNAASASPSRTRTPRRYKAKFTTSGKNGRNHENSPHSGADHSQTSRCSLCNLIFYNSPPFAPSSWLRIVYETIRLLHDEGNPHRKYFHYKHDICNFIDTNWTKLCPDKKRTLTWNNTVSAVITTHRKLFKSNARQSGFWTLMPPPGMASLASDGDSDDENVDYAEKAREMKAQSRNAAKLKKRKYSDVSATPQAASGSRSVSSPVSYYKGYYSDGPSAKIRKTALVELHQPKPDGWHSPMPVYHPDESDLPYIPISARRRSRPPASPFFTRVHARLQATADRSLLLHSHTHHSHQASYSPSHTSLTPPHPPRSRSPAPSTSYSATLGYTSLFLHGSLATANSPSHTQSPEPLPPSDSPATSSSGQPTAPSSPRPFTLSVSPPSPSPSSSPAPSSRASKRILASPPTTYAPSARQAKIIATTNLMVTTAGLLSNAQNPTYSPKIPHLNGFLTRHESPGPSRPHPQILDPVIVPLPHGWFEKSVQHPSLRKRSTSQDIPLPVWRELTDEEEHQFWVDTKDEPDDEDISDIRFIIQHREYEREERKLKKLCS